MRKKRHRRSRVPAGRSACFKDSTPWLASLFPPIVRLRGVPGLPLHVAGSVIPAALERHDVVDHVAGAGTRTLSRCGTDGVARSLVWQSRFA